MACILKKNEKILISSRPQNKIFSGFFEFPGGKINYSYNLNKIVDYYNLYLDIMSYWNHLLPDFIYNLKYENLISKQDKEIRNLLNFCNLYFYPK